MIKTVVHKHRRGRSIVKAHKRRIKGRNAEMYSYSSGGLPGVTKIGRSDNELVIIGRTKAKFLKQPRFGERYSRAVEEADKVMRDRHYPEMEEEGGWFK